jgi:hypothetical protein
MKDPVHEADILDVIGDRKADKHLLKEISGLLKFGKMKLKAQQAQQAIAMEAKAMEMAQAKQAPLALAAMCTGLGAIIFIFSVCYAAMCKAALKPFVYRFIEGRGDCQCEEARRARKLNGRRVEGEHYKHTEDGRRLLIIFEYKETAGTEDLIPGHETFLDGFYPNGPFLVLSFFPDATPTNFFGRRKSAAAPRTGADVSATSARGNNINWSTARARQSGARAAAVALHHGARSYSLNWTDVLKTHASKLARRGVPSIRTRTKRLVCGATRCSPGARRASARWPGAARRSR